VKECEEDDPVFKPQWLDNVVPFRENEPSKCLRYASPYSFENCSQAIFNKTQTERCTDFVYQYEGESTIANAFGMTCDDELWKLTIVGTINNVGFIIGLPLSGYISDRYGRRTMMIGSVLCSLVFGLVKSFSPSYTFFLMLEFLDMCFGGGTYSATYILGMEMLTAKHRVIGSTVMSCAFAVGEALMGLTAWMTLSWRVYLRILYIPGLIFISYIWATDESVRWLISKERNTEAKKILKKIAKENNRTLKNSTMKQLNIIKEDKEHIAVDSFADVFKSPVLLTRMLNCSFAWICCTFVYYGLTMHSVGISGNMYINYIAVALIEIPAYIAANFSLSRMGRKYSLSSSLLLSGMACIGFVFTPEDDRTLRLILFLAGKFSVTISYASIYLYTTEMFPTSLRHSSMSFCSTFGRIGSMIAPQVPILAQISKSLPLVLFSVMATCSGALSLLFPETLNVVLPETIADAVKIGKL